MVDIIFGSVSLQLHLIKSDSPRNHINLQGALTTRQWQQKEDLFQTICVLKNLSNKGSNVRFSADSEGLSRQAKG